MSLLDAAYDDRYADLLPAPQGEKHLNPIQAKHASLRRKNLYRSPVRVL